MKFPVDLLADVSQTELERLAQNYMNNLLYSSPDSVEHLSLPDSSQVAITISTVGFVPLYGSNVKQRILALFSPRDPSTAVALYLLDQWYTVDEILKTSDTARDGAVEVETIGERIVLYILNRVIYRAKEMSSEERPFLCHEEKDNAKILWKNGEAVGFYSVKTSGSMYNSVSTTSYQLPVMDTIFVRKCQRGKGFGLQMLEHFVLCFKDDCLGLRYPLTKSMYKVCEKYLYQYPGDTDLLWEVEGVGRPNQRTKIASKIQAMNQSVSKILSFTEESFVITEMTETDVVMETIATQITEAKSMECTVGIMQDVTVLSGTEDADVPLTARERISGSKQRKMGKDKSEKVIRTEDIEAETHREEQVSVQQKTEVHNISELMQTENTGIAGPLLPQSDMFSVAPEEQGEDVVDSASEEADTLSEQPHTVLAPKHLEEAVVTSVPLTEESQVKDDTPQDLNNTSCCSHITVENVASEIEEECQQKKTAELVVCEKDLEIHKEAETLDKVEEGTQIGVTDEKSEESVTQHKASPSLNETSENDEAGKTGGTVEMTLTTVQSKTPKQGSKRHDMLTEAQDAGIILRRRTVTKTPTPKRKWTRRSQKVSGELAEAEQNEVSTVEVVEELTITEGEVVMEELTGKKLTVVKEGTISKPEDVTALTEVDMEESKEVQEEEEATEESETVSVMEARKSEESVTQHKASPSLNDTSENDEAGKTGGTVEMTQTTVQSITPKQGSKRHDELTEAQDAGIILRRRTVTKTPTPKRKWTRRSQKVSGELAEAEQNEVSTVEVVEDLAITEGEVVMEELTGEKLTVVKEGTISKPEDVTPLTEVDMEESKEVQEEEEATEESETVSVLEAEKSEESVTQHKASPSLNETSENDEAGKTVEKTVTTVQSKTPKQGSKRHGELTEAQDAGIILRRRTVTKIPTPKRKWTRRSQKVSGELAEAEQNEVSTVEVVEDLAITEGEVVMEELTGEKLTVVKEGTISKPEDVTPLTEVDMEESKEVQEEEEATEESETVSVLEAEKSEESVTQHKASPSLNETSENDEVGKTVEKTVTTVQSKTPKQGSKRHGELTEAQDAGIILRRRTVTKIPTPKRKWTRRSQKVSGELAEAEQNEVSTVEVVEDLAITEGEVVMEELTGEKLTVVKEGTISKPEDVTPLTEVDMEESKEVQEEEEATEESETVSVLEAEKSEESVTQHKASLSLNETSENDEAGKTVEKTVTTVQSKTPKQGSKRHGELTEAQDAGIILRRRTVTKIPTPKRKWTRRSQKVSGELAEAEQNEVSTVEVVEDLAITEGEVVMEELTGEKLTVVKEGTISKPEDVTPLTEVDMEESKEVQEEEEATEESETVSVMEAQKSEEGVTQHKASPSLNETSENDEAGKTGGTVEMTQTTVQSITPKQGSKRHDELTEAQDAGIILRRRTVTKIPTPKRKWTRRSQKVSGELAEAEQNEVSTVEVVEDLAITEGEVVMEELTGEKLTVVKEGTISKPEDVTPLTEVDMEESKEVQEEEEATEESETVSVLEAEKSEESVTQHKASPSLNETSENDEAGKTVEKTVTTVQSKTPKQGSKRHGELTEAQDAGIILRRRTVTKIPTPKRKWTRRSQKVSGELAEAEQNEVSTVEVVEDLAITEGEVVMEELTGEKLTVVKEGTISKPEDVTPLTEVDMEESKEVQEEEEATEESETVSVMEAEKEEEAFGVTDVEDNVIQEPDTVPAATGTETPDTAPDEPQEKEFGSEIPKLQKATVILVDIKTAYHDLSVKEAEDTPVDEESGAPEKQQEEEDGGEHKKAEQPVDETAETETVEKEPLEEDKSEMEVDEEEIATDEVEGEMKAVPEDPVKVIVPVEENASSSEICTDKEADIPVGDDDAEKNLPAAEVDEAMSSEEEEAPVVVTRVLRCRTKTSTTTPRRTTRSSQKQVEKQEAEISEEEPAMTKRTLRHGRISASGTPKGKSRKPHKQIQEEEQKREEESISVEETSAPPTEESRVKDDAPQDLNTPCDTQITVENVVSEIEEECQQKETAELVVCEKFLEIQKEAETLDKFEEETQIGVTDEKSEERVTHQEVSPSLNDTSENDEAGKTGGTVEKTVTTVQSITPKQGSKRHGELTEAQDAGIILRGRTVTKTPILKPKWTRSSQKVSGELAEVEQNEVSTVEVVEDLAITEGEEQEAITSVKEGEVVMEELIEKKQQLEDEQPTNKNKQQEPEVKDTSMELPETALRKESEDGSEKEPKVEGVETSVIQDEQAIDRQMETHLLVEQEQAVDKTTEEIATEELTVVKEGTISKAEDVTPLTEVAMEESKEVQEEDEPTKESETVSEMEAEKEEEAFGVTDVEDNVIQEPDTVPAATGTETPDTAPDEPQEKEFGSEIPKLQEATVILVDIKTAYHDLSVKEAEDTPVDGESGAPEKQQEEEDGGKHEQTDQPVDAIVEAETVEKEALKEGKSDMEVDEEEIATDEVEGETKAVPEDAVKVIVPVEENASSSEICTDKEADITEGDDDAEENLPAAEVDEAMSSEEEAPVVVTRALRCRTKTSTTTPRRTTRSSQKQEAEISEEQPAMTTRTLRHGRISASGTPKGKSRKPHKQIREEDQKREEESKRLREIGVEEEAVDEAAVEKTEKEIEEKAEEIAENVEEEAASEREEGLERELDLKEGLAVAEQGQDAVEDISEDVGDEKVELPPVAVTRSLRSGEKAREEDKTEVEIEGLVAEEEEKGTMTMAEEKESTAGVIAAAFDLVQEETGTPLPEPANDSAILSCTHSVENQQSEKMAPPFSDLQRVTVVLVDLKKSPHGIQEETAAVDDGLPVQKSVDEAEKEHIDDTTKEEETMATSTSEEAEGTAGKCVEETLLTAKDDAAADVPDEEEAPVVETRLLRSGETTVRATKRQSDEQEEEATEENNTEEDEPAVETRVLRRGRRSAAGTPRHKSKRARTQCQTEEEGEEDTPPEEIQVDEAKAELEEAEEKEESNDEKIEDKDGDEAAALKEENTELEVETEKAEVVAEESVTEQETVEESAVSETCADGQEETSVGERTEETPNTDEGNDTVEEAAPTVETRLLRSGEKTLRARARSKTTKRQDDDKEEEATEEKSIEENEPAVEKRVIRRGRRSAAAIPTRKSKRARTQFQTEEEGEEEDTEKIQVEEEDIGQESPEEEGVEVEEKGKHMEMEKENDVEDEEIESTTGGESLGDVEQMKGAAVLEEEDNGVEYEDAVGSDTVKIPSTGVEETNSTEKDETAVVEKSTAAIEMGSDIALAEEVGPVEDASRVSEEETPAATRALRSKERKTSHATLLRRSRRQKDQEVVDAQQEEEKPPEEQKKPQRLPKRPRVDYMESEDNERNETEAAADKEEEDTVESAEHKDNKKAECSDDEAEEKPDIHLTLDTDEEVAGISEDDNDEQNKSEEEVEPILIRKKVLRGRTVPSVIITPQSKSRSGSYIVEKADEEKSPQSAQKRKSPGVTLTRKSKRLSRV